MGRGLSASFPGSIRGYSMRRSALSGLAVPVPHIPQIVVPAAEMGLQLLRDRRDPRAVHDRDDIRFADDQIIHFDEQGGSFHRIELAFRRGVGLVVFLVAPARDVAPLPFVFFRGDLGRRELANEWWGAG